ncbi:unnamed protein product [Prorocentrum cordatum]|uniref:Uncharacterized protein n=1 Tax=Prorocentrum cordatum TaxID=2364126 RepID=A0ABN9T0Q4_9DINO|nr:unnamed protein product [Polarella glacialis]
MAVFPMGFSWSVFWAQRINARLVREASGMEGSVAVEDRGGGLIISKDSAPVFYVYVDNVGVLGADKIEVQKSLDNIKNVLNSNKMQCHEVQEAGQVRDALGIEFNGALKCFRSAGKRYWKIRWTLEAFLKAPKVTGKALEVLLGHCTYLAMLQRPLLSCFALVYKFARRCRHSWAPLWPTAREELVRRAAALALSRNLSAGFRWIPSEFNSSDKPSRDPGLRRGDTVELSVTPDIRLVDYVDERKLNTDKVQDFDVAIVSFMTHMYMLGYDAGIGQKLIAAVVFFQPRFGKLGLAALLAYEGHLDMAIWTIIAFCTYLRPGSMMQLTRGSLVPPTMKVDTMWRVLAHRSDLNQVSKGVRNGTCWERQLGSARITFEWNQWAKPGVSAHSPLRAAWNNLRERVHADNAPLPGKGGAAPASTEEVRATGKVPLPLSDNDLEKKVAKKKTALALAVERESKAERVALYDVEQKLASVARHKEALAKAQDAHAESAFSLEKADAAHRTAYAEMDSFDPQVYRLQIVAEERAERERLERERGQAAAAAACPSVHPKHSTDGRPAKTAANGGTGPMDVDAERPAPAQGAAGPAAAPQPPDLMSFSDDDLRKLRDAHNQRFEYWIQIKSFKSHNEEDNLFDAPSDVGNDESYRDELDALKKRSIEVASSAGELERLEELMQKRYQIKKVEEVEDNGVFNNKGALQATGQCSNPGQLLAKSERVGHCVESVLFFVVRRLDGEALKAEYLDVLTGAISAGVNAAWKAARTNSRARMKASEASGMPSREEVAGPHEGSPRLKLFREIGGLTGKGTLKVWAGYARCAEQFYSKTDIPDLERPLQEWAADQSDWVTMDPFNLSYPIRPTQRLYTTIWSKDMQPLDTVPATIKWDTCDGPHTTDSLADLEMQVMYNALCQ